MVVQRLEVLDVQRRDHVDPGREDLFDILVALGVRGAGGVRVGELVDQTQLGRAVENRREIHLFERRVPVGHTHQRQPWQPLGQLSGLSATVCLEQADRDVMTRPHFRLSLEQHAIGLARPGGHPEEDLQAPVAPIG